MKTSIVTEYWRWTLGGAILNIFNFGLLATAFSPQISQIFMIDQRAALVGVIFLAFFASWAIGFVLDKMRYQQGMTHVNLARNPIYEEVFARLDRIEKKIEESDEKRNT